MIATAIHLPAAELHRFATATDQGADHFEWARHHLNAGCKVCGEIVHAAQQRARAPVAPDLPNWIRPQRVHASGGSRAGMLADTKLVCGAGPYEVDVLVREFAAPECLEFLGQVTRGDSIHHPVAELPLSLVRAEPGEVVSTTSTDEFGEFDLSSDPVGAYGLRLGDDDDAPCVLVWEGGA